MILRELETQGEIVRTIPTAKELEDEKFDDDFIIGILSKKPVGVLVQFVEKMLDVKAVKGEVVEVDKLLVERRGTVQSTNTTSDEPQKQVKLKLPPVSRRPCGWISKNWTI